MAVSRAVMAALVTVATLVAPARADDAARAREVAARGVAAAGEGRRTGNPAHFDEAIARFKEAFAIHPDPEYQCNIGIAYRDRKDPARAHLFIGRCVARMGAAPERKAALGRVLAGLEAELQRSHVPVDVIAEPAGALVTVSAFAADEAVPAPWLLWLPPGRHLLEARASGFTPARRELEVAAGMAKQTVTLTLTAVPAAPAPVEPPARVVEPPAGSAGVAVPAPAGAPPRDQPRPVGLTTWLLIGGGAAALAGGGVMHVITWRNIGDLDGLSGSERERRVSTIEKQRALTIGLYAAGGLAAGAGLWLYLRGRERAPAVSLVPADGGGAMVVWSGVR